MAAWLLATGENALESVAFPFEIDEVEEINYFRIPQTTLKYCFFFFSSVYYLACE